MLPRFDQAARVSPGVARTQERYEHALVALHVALAAGEPPHRIDQLRVVERDAARAMGLPGGEAAGPAGGE